MTTLAAVYTVLNFLINEAQIFILVPQPAVYYPAGHTTERPLAVSFPGMGPITNNIINVANNNNMYSKVTAGELVITARCLIRLNVIQLTTNYDE